MSFMWTYSWKIFKTPTGFFTPIRDHNILQTDSIAMQHTCWNEPSVSTNLEATSFFDSSLREYII